MRRVDRRSFVRSTVDALAANRSYRNDKVPRWAYISRTLFRPIA